MEFLVGYSNYEINLPYKTFIMQFLEIKTALSSRE